MRTHRTSIHTLTYTGVHVLENLQFTCAIAHNIHKYAYAYKQNFGHEAAAYTHIHTCMFFTYTDIGTLPHRYIHICTFIRMCVYIYISSEFIYMYMHYRWCHHITIHIPRYIRACTRTRMQVVYNTHTHTCTHTPAGGTTHTHTYLYIRKHTHM